MFTVIFQGYKIFRREVAAPPAEWAFANAVDVLHLESWLHLGFELSLQEWVLRQGNWLILNVNRVYANYMVGFYVCLLILAVMSPARYRYIRRAWWISVVLATPMYRIYPLAPPRFMEPYGWPFVDTIVKYGPYYLKPDDPLAANQYAAMPSMHMAWTTFFALSLMLAIPQKWIGRLVAGLIILAMAMAVMITANHYWLDIVMGWVLIGAALLINAWLERWLVRRSGSGSSLPKTSPAA